MRAVTLEMLAQAMEGRLVQGQGVATRLHTDTRTLREGDCFVALRGDQFDGHDYVALSAKQGAMAAVVSKIPTDALPEGFGLILVDDPLKALQRYAHFYRKSLKVRVVGVTGSSGKTSTKEFIKAVLAQKFKTQATVGNLNNHIGVPLTLLSLEEETEWVVVEMGMNHPGEIAPLAKMSEPDFGVITRIGHTHLESFTNIQGIAQEKSELFHALKSTGKAFLNAEDGFCSYLCGRTSARTVLVGDSSLSTWKAQEVRVTSEGLEFELEHDGQRVAVKLPLWNRVMIQNALLAAAVGFEAGLSLTEIAQGLQKVELPGQRMKIHRLQGALWINDSYNANPESMESAVDTLMEIPFEGVRVAVLGSMGELGSQAEMLHREVGSYAARRGVPQVVAVGPMAAAIAEGVRQVSDSKTEVFTAGNAEESIEILKKGSDLRAVLVKGSRFMKLEKVVEHFTGQGGGH
ncbi:MAG: UDP-N-acetylmuramoyl-tripeptide--D-alanyl-D-alanine ligase [Verrucomicrobiota bacterium]